MIEGHINVEVKPEEVIKINIERNETQERMLEYYHRLSAIGANQQ